MYIYKKLNYDQAHDAWLARRPKDKNGVFYEVGTPEYSRWAKHEPSCVTELQPAVDHVNIDIVRGPLTMRKLLVHVRVVKKFPFAVLRDVILSNKNRHKNRGPYDHVLRINVYTDDFKYFKFKEVDLWQEIDIDALMVDVNRLQAEARTREQVQRVYRF